MHDEEAWPAQRAAQPKGDTKRRLPAPDIQLLRRPLPVVIDGQWHALAAADPERYRDIMEHLIERVGSGPGGVCRAARSPGANLVERLHG